MYRPIYYLFRKLFIIYLEKEFLDSLKIYFNMIKISNHYLLVTCCIFINICKFVATYIWFYFEKIKLNANLVHILVYILYKRQKH